MNKHYDGRPQWSNWGGLNDVLRNQEFTNGFDAADHMFGGINGNTNINVRPSQARKGASASYATTNRSYTNRLMASYASGASNKGWAYSLSISKRWGNEGYVDGTNYDASSFFAAVEKQINEKHSIALTGIYTPNHRGRSSPNTQEVYDLRDIRYNEYWGYQEGVKRNSRIKKVEEPIVIINHFWNIKPKTQLSTNLAYQFGSRGSSRLDFRNANNPSAAYYRKLPSYNLSLDPINYELVYTNEQQFIRDGQLDWNRLYEENIGGTSNYVIYDDRTEDKQLTASTIFQTSLSKSLILNASLEYEQLLSHNFAQLTDLLGGDDYVNTDTFDGYQFDLQNPDQNILKDDKFRYNYKLYSTNYGGFLQLQGSAKKLNYFIATELRNVSYQREGIFQSEAYATNSFGKGAKINFLNTATKMGGTYSINGRNAFQINAMYRIKAPNLRNSFSNVRESHDIVRDLQEERITSIDVSYLFSFSKLKGRLTGFYTTLANTNEISYYFTDGLGGDTAAFVQEILLAARKKNFGAELGVESQVTSSIKLKGALSLGQYTYDNNPQLYLTSQDIDTGILELGEVQLKNYKQANGPQQAYSIGFEYRDPDYWWFSSTANFFSNTYVDVSVLPRTNNFYQDDDGMPISNVDNDLARSLLKQEKFEPYMILNAVGGKSWRVDKYYLGFFASINNLLNRSYKTGGYEQGRSSNYKQLKEDKALEKRIFGPKYWYGRGTNFFIGSFFRF
jgi:hypothetical protein